jgi:glucoamylase
LHWRVASTRAALVLVAAGALAVALVSGGSPTDPRTPAGLPGLPPPFLGTAVVGAGGLTAAIDAYGGVVDLRAPGPAGRPLVDNPAARQAAGSVAADTGIVPRVRIAGGKPRPLWRADSVSQRYLRGTNVVRATARFGPNRVAITYAARPDRLACLTHASGGTAVSFESSQPAAALRLRCDDQLASDSVAAAVAADRGWLSRARRLDPNAPRWARRLYERSLLVLRALSDRRTGAVAAGARDRWAYVWPRDAGTAALALAGAGYRPEARRIAGFLLGLDLAAAARFHGDGVPVAGREAQGDASGWVAVAARAAGLPVPRLPLAWRQRADYQEREPGTYLGNALAAAAEPVAVEDFATPRGLVRRAGDPGSGLDSAAAWAVRPFAQPALFPVARRTLLRLAADQTRFGIAPGENWPGVDPWTAPTAWTAWSLAALGERRQALRLLGDLRRAATPAGALPERVDARTGVPTSTTPLVWSHAFAVLALRQLWP